MQPTWVVHGRLIDLMPPQTRRKSDAQTDLVIDGKSWAAKAATRNHRLSLAIWRGIGEPYALCCYRNTTHLHILLALPVDIAFTQPSMEI
jgi:hypothetical protein